MKWFFFLITLVLLISSQDLYAQDATDNIHYILVIDKTKSMIGQGDGNGINIWGDVLNATNNFIENLPDKGKVSIYTYADALSDKAIYDLEDPGSKDKIIKFLSNISLDGNFTAVYDAMDKVFKAEVKPDLKYPLLIYLFTDGKDNRSLMDFESIIKYYEANRADNAYTYYIKLRGNLDPVVRQKIDESAGIKYIEVDKISALPVTVIPKFPKLVYNLAIKSVQTQLFEISGEKLGQNFKFDAKLLDADPTLGNISLSKSTGYVISGDNNECEFEIKVYGDLKTEKQKVYKAKIKLSNPQDGVHKITFSPDEFELEFSNVNPPKVVIKQLWKRK